MTAQTRLRNGEIATWVQPLTAFAWNSNKKPLHIMSEYEGISAFQQDVTKHLPAAGLNQLSFQTFRQVVSYGDKFDTITLLPNLTVQFFQTFTSLIHSAELHSMM